MRNTAPAMVAALLVAACSAAAPEAEPVRPVVTQRVTPGAVASRDVYSGELRARHETDLAFRIGGKILSRSVDAGARVSQGQVLARLDPEDARLAAQAATAQLASAESDLRFAKSELDRYADLLAKKFISQSAYDVKQNTFNAAQAKVEQARSQAAINANQAAYTNLAADSDGVVVSVSGEPGQVVTAGQPVLKLAHAGEKDVVVNAPEGQLARFKTGQDVTIQLWADPSKVFRGRIREIAGGADPVTRTYAVRVAAIDPPAEAQLGMTANVLFNPQSDVRLVLLPLSALAGSQQQPAVWIVDPKTSRVQLRNVSVGQYREDGVIITSGLDAGDIVVTAGVHRLRNDQPVRLASSAGGQTQQAQSN
ncbi:MAG TPA: efflux RND transporter periplasmic adaptor subunit [Usitatibacter sp.]|nr:efflux RND transporter periplasmic adaptor subunit [Usitatibacter sp.]